LFLCFAKWGDEISSKYSQLEYFRATAQDIICGKNLEPTKNRVLLNQVFNKVFVGKNR